MSISAGKRGLMGTWRGTDRADGWEIKASSNAAPRAALTGRSNCLGLS